MTATVLSRTALGVYLFVTVVVYADAGAIPAREAWRKTLTRAREELFPFIAPLAVLHYFAQVVAERGDNPLFNKGAVFRLVMWAFIWYIAYRRGGGGGRWKRRLRRWVSKVAIQGRRLAVVRTR